MPWASDAPLLGKLVALFVACTVLGASMGFGQLVGRGGAGAFLGLVFFLGCSAATATLLDVHVALGIGFILIYTIGGLVAASKTAD
jgi:hypothetical protein